MTAHFYTHHRTPLLSVTPQKPNSSAPVENQDSPAKITPDCATQTGPNALPVARPVRRIAALVYDLFLLVAISMAYGGIFLIIQAFIGGNAVTQVLTEGQATTRIKYEGSSQYLFLFGWWLCLALFYSWCWRRSGQTLGMKTWHICLEQRDESVPGTSPFASWRQCWVRCLLAPPALFCGGLSYLYCLFNPEGHCMHDIWSQTRVVVLPKTKTRTQLNKEAIETRDKQASSS